MTMTDASYPDLTNWIAGEPAAARGGATFEKCSPADGARLGDAPRSTAEDVEAAVAAARVAQPAWAAKTPVDRGFVLHAIVRAMQDRSRDLAAVVARETGKSPKDAAGEVGAAIACGLFWAGEGQRLYGRTLTSGVANRQVLTIRQPVGVAGLIVPANTPIANVAWKVFPALVCGNTAVLKSAEDTPATAVLFATIAHEAGLPAGVLNVVHGYGPEAGAALVAHEAVGVISFTGSTATGRRIQAAAGDRLARVSLELGGKNPLVVCDDADLDRAVQWTALSAFSNAGQRCAAASRIVVDAAVYDEFSRRLLARTAALKVGPSDDDDLGPVINARQLGNMLAALERGRAAGIRVLAGGHRLEDAGRAAGYYLAPTVLENVPRDHELSSCELFGPITALYKVSGFEEALAVAADSPYGLTAAIHTRSIDRALVFAQRMPAGVVSVNGGTHGSEAHMPFGGVKQSGNGTREPGTEALDIYTHVKNVYLNAEPSRL